MAETQCGFDDIPGGATGSELLAAYGPTIKVDIGFDPALKQGTIPVAGLKGIDALIDTGASESCIDSLLASQLNLPIVDRQTVSGSAGAHQVNMHLAEVYFPALNFVLAGKFAAVDLAAGGQPHKALIGRSFLMHYTMTYEGKTGKVKLSS